MCFLLSFYPFMLCMVNKFLYHHGCVLCIRLAGRWWCSISVICDCNLTEVLAVLFTYNSMQCNAIVQAGEITTAGLCVGGWPTCDLGDTGQVRARSRVQRSSLGTMPLAKAVVERSALPGGLVDSERLNVIVIDALRQLARLTAVCDVMFTELLTDTAHLADRLTSLTARTTKLADRLESLDALNVTVRTYTHTSTCS